MEPEATNLEIIDYFSAEAFDQLVSAEVILPKAIYCKYLI
jgi:hypothetical protein